ncbi:FAD-linked oxidase C-terminal domain-containing protein [Thiomicrorhabdus sediminis]|uniref:FAD-binding protein n=1 Tax=Thiomicrorhabdus sediminis TaxID=2580412 RepID=A0A4V1HHI9_9GAMM|nr:FAD-linked oxidase C-terminal domain-containing protein [Thiomicrorhabdus sediminis]QCU89183.1 FAD-binding protein [Thiomicrorhabdus sediminis]
MALIEALEKAIGKDNVLSSEEACRPYECDALSAYRQKPLAVALPENVDQVRQVLKLCKQYQTPVITRGSGTGLAGGTLPQADSVILGLAKLNQILQIDPLQRTAIVQPGVRNITISEAAAKYNLYYAPDPSSQIACSIGGNVAENSGGVHCLKYGLTVHNVTSITVLDMDGDPIIFDEKDDGIDLLALMNGSEGLLGVIVEIKLKLLPKPEAAQLVMAAFNSVDQCADAVTSVLKQGIIPAGLEMMDQFAIQAAEDFAQVGYPTDAAALLLCEVDGSHDQVQVDSQRVADILSANGAHQIQVSQNESQRLALWQGRKNAFPAVGRYSPDYYCMDGTIPRSQLAYVLQKISQLSNKYGLRVANVFHAGDGNLHPLILYDANKPGELEQTEKFGAEILRLCVDVGGTITGEHGVGVEKLDSMCHQYSDAELEVFHGIKKVFDNTGLLNPGKAVPTLHRCAELGHMHVHNNQLPHPELERF